MAAVNSLTAVPTACPLKASVQSPLPPVANAQGYPVLSCVREDFVPAWLPGGSWGAGLPGPSPGSGSVGQGARAEPQLTFSSWGPAQPQLTAASSEPEDTGAKGDQRQTQGDPRQCQSGPEFKSQLS